MACKSQRIPAGREGARMNPTGGVIQKLAANGIERNSLTPRAWFWAGIDAFDKTREYSRMRIGRSSGKQHRVRMPGKRRNSTADRLLEMF